MNLLECLDEVSDFRRPQGRRYPLTMVLLISIMGIASGTSSTRELSTFARAHESEFVKWFGLKRTQLPSHVTFRALLKEIKFEELCNAFQKWASSQIKLAPKDWIALDGKALGSTVTESQNSYQNFVSLVSAFAHQQQQVLGVALLENKKQSEIPAVQGLIQLLDLKEVVFTLDALHCQKKQPKSFAKAEMIL